MDANSRRIRSGWHVAAAICFALTFVAYFWSESYADINGPRYPSPTTGQIIALNRHGHVVYLTRAQEHSRSVLLGTAGALMLSAFALEFVANRKRG